MVSSLTRKEIESDDRPVRIPIVINRFSRPDNLVCQRDEVPNRRTRSNVFEVRSTFRLQAFLPVLLQLGIRLRNVGVKLLEFLGIPKICRNCLVDGPHDGVIPKGGLFRIGLETSYVARAVLWRDASGCQGKGEKSPVNRECQIKRINAFSAANSRGAVLVGLRTLLGHNGETHNV